MLLIIKYGIVSYEHSFEVLHYRILEDFLKSNNLSNITYLLSNHGKYRLHSIISMSL
jgi:hypothetical protein